MISDINAEALKQLPKGINTAVLDVTNSTAVKEYCNQLEKVDVLFNVAGWVPHGSVLDSTEEEWNKCMDLNVTSMFRMERVHLLNFISQKYFYPRECLFANS